MSARERAIHRTRTTGVLPAIKLKQDEDIVPYVRAMVDGGARVVEVTMTTPGVLEMFRALAKEFGDEISTAAGTVLDAAAAREAIAAGARVIVSPAVVPEVIATAHRYGAACYAGAFTATECLTAVQAGADMVKIFPAAVAGPAYMTNLRMVYPEINLIPSGGISLDNAADFIRSGASAISGARNFFNREAVAREGLAWITDQVATYIDLVAQAKATAEPLP
ncbi:MAG: 2-dehydro-3-deoxyphosphogluconate aldolase [Thermomicrobiales bacterium]|jgi:2-dehydro-3-deoxyphosphogluconate aldolase/(4S)-4-hydroxy-2-oxoglutarate aldolase|nr:2-dehydro-3-deoxyphosphogluconate aldolase [Thermomicrobiales bacterium]